MTEPGAGSRKPTRRAILSAGAMSGLSLAWAARAGGSAMALPASKAPRDTLALPQGTNKLGQGSFQLFAATDLNFQTLFALGGAGLNSEVGEVVSVVDQANAAAGGASYQSVFDAFVAMGDRLTDAAASAADKGHVVTARDRRLRAAQYYNQALFWVLGTSTPDREPEVYRTMNDSWTEAAKLMEPAAEFVEIPYNGATFPAWFLAPRGASGPRPTLIMSNGSDGQNVDMIAQGGASALARGWNVLVFEGPGQGLMLFERKIPFTPEWHEVISPIVDVLQQRSDVEPSKIALLGISFSGTLVVRAAAFEHRLAAVVSDPGSTNVYAPYPKALQNIAAGTNKAKVNAIWVNDVVAGSDAQQTFGLKKRLEIYSTEALDQVRAGKVPTNWYGLSRILQSFTATDLVDQITTPFLVIDYQQENFFPGQAKQLYQALPGKKTIVTLTTAEGAEYHDGPMAPQWHGEVIMDWLQETVG